MQKLGLLIVGHGTRDARGLAGFGQLVDQVRARMPKTPIEACFLELAAPNIEEGFTRLAHQGVEEIVVLPLLLFAAGHVRRDIPAATGQVATGFPRVRVRQASHLGCHPRIVELSRRRYQEALDGRAMLPPEDSLLLLVGRGSRDHRATEEMHQMADLRRKTAGGVAVETCFTAMERPLLDESLFEIGARPVRRIIVQPHLLFPGYLTTKIDRAVERERALRPGIEWIVAEPLGADRLLVEAVVEIAGWGGERGFAGFPDASVDLVARGLSGYDEHDAFES